MYPLIRPPYPTTIRLSLFLSSTGGSLEEQQASVMPGTTQGAGSHGNSEENPTDGREARNAGLSQVRAHERYRSGQDGAGRSATSSYSRGFRLPGRVGGSELLAVW